MKNLEILAGSTNPEHAYWGYLPYIFISIGNIFWSLAWIYANQHQVNFAESSMIRGITCFGVNYFMCKYFQCSTEFKSPITCKVLTLRSMLMVIHGFMFGLSQYLLPLPIVHTINCCGTLFIFLIDFLLNHVKTNLQQGIGIIIGLIGAIVATNGQIITKYIDPSYEMKTKYQNYLTDDPLLLTIFSILFLGGVACWALGIVITKKARANTFQINYILGLCLFLSGATVYPYIETKCSKIQLFISVLTLGFPLVFGQWFFIGALTMTKQTGVLNMMNFLTIFIGYVVSIFRYGQTSNIISIIGIGLVFIGVYKTIFNKQQVK